MGHGDTHEEIGAKPVTPPDGKAGFFSRFSTILLPLVKLEWEGGVE